MIKSKDYDELLAQRAKLLKKRSEIQSRIDTCETAIRDSRRDFKLACKCGKETRVGDLEVVRREYGGFYSNSDECWISSHENLIACLTCVEMYRVPEDATIWPEGIVAYCKIVLKWDSDRTRMTGRVAEILGPVYAKRDAKRSAEDRARRLAEARALIAEEEKRASAGGGD